MEKHKKIQHEKELVEKMIQLYCRKKHQNNQLCKDCQDLLNYALKRIDACPMMDTKTFCSSCKIHCYQAEKREKIKEVMRFSGPRLLFSHPFALLRHIFDSKQKRKNK